MFYSLNLTLHCEALFGMIICKSEWVSERLNNIGKCTSVQPQSHSVLQGKLLSVGPNKAAVCRFLVQKTEQIKCISKGLCAFRVQENVEDNTRLRSALSYLLSKRLQEHSHYLFNLVLVTLLLRTASKSSHLICRVKNEGKFP